GKYALRLDDEEGCPLFEEGCPLFEEGCPLFEEGCPLFEEGCPLFEEGCPLLFTHQHVPRLLKGMPTFFPRLERTYHALPIKLAMTEGEGRKAG
ncbi:MAG: hypothetical protein IKY97_02075, partial [Mailhella sp.]|nr:hypothetical protein [Mailhella sp.]